MANIETPKETYQQIITMLIIVIIIPLIAVAYVLNQQKNERINCGSLSKVQIQYLFDSGVDLPAACYRP